MERNLTAVELIKRFRESKPTSREQREQKRVEAGAARKMWWETDNNLQSTSERRNSANYLNDNSALIMRDYNDFQSDSNQDLRPFTKDFQRMENRSANFVSGSFPAIRQGLEDDDTDWFSVRRAPEFTRNSIDSLRDVEFPRTSIESQQKSNLELLGSTGMLGLLKSELKLDGSHGHDLKSEEKRVADLNSSLEELLKSLNGNGVVNNSGFESVTIPEITNKLNTEILEFVGYYESKSSEQKEIEKHKELLRQEGREEERKKQLLDQLDDPKEAVKEKFLAAWSLPLLPEDPRLKTGNESDETIEEQGLPITHESDETIEKQGFPITQREFLLSRIACETELERADNIYTQMRNMCLSLRKNHDRLQRGFLMENQSRSKSRSLQSNSFEDKCTSERSFVELDSRVLHRTAQNIDVSLTATMAALNHRLPSIDATSHPESVRISVGKSDEIKPTTENATNTREADPSLSDSADRGQEKMEKNPFPQSISVVKSSNDEFKFIDEVLGSGGKIGLMNSFAEKRKIFPGYSFVEQDRESKQKNALMSQNDSNFPRTVRFEADTSPTAPAWMPSQIRNHLNANPFPISEQQFVLSGEGTNHEVLKLRALASKPVEGISVSHLRELQHANNSETNTHSSSRIALRNLDNLAVHKPSPPPLNSSIFQKQQYLRSMQDLREEMTKTIL